MIDYQRILVEYIRHVLEQEGVDFLDDIMAFALRGLSTEELQEFERLRDIARKS